MYFVMLMLVANLQKVSSTNIIAIWSNQITVGKSERMQSYPEPCNMDIETILE